MLCWFFVKKHPDDEYYEKHNINDLKRFFSLIVKVTNRKESELKRINDFFTDIDFIRQHIASPFDLYDYEINENWEVSIVERVEYQDDEDIIPELSNGDKSQNEIYSDKDEELDEVSDNVKTSWFQSIRDFIKEYRVTIVILASLCLGLFMFFSIKDYFERQTKIAENRNLIELANAERNTRSIKITNLLNIIDKELKDDYLDDGIKNLSNESISRIISLSEGFKPYLYLRNNDLISRPLSRERAELFRGIISLDLDQDTYNKIFARADFSYSDFSSMDFSNVKLTDLVDTVISGSGFSTTTITLTKRPNFKYSDFTNVSLSKTSLYGDFSGSDFSKSKITGTEFAYSKLDSCNFSGNTAVLISFSSEFTNCNFRNSKLYASFFHADLRGSVFDGSKISKIRAYLEEGNHIENRYVKGYDFFGSFIDTFVSGDDLLYEDILEINDYYSSYDFSSISAYDSFHDSGLAVLTTSHRNTNNDNIESKKIILALRKNEKGKDSVAETIFTDTYEGFDLNTFIKPWKDDVDNFYRYQTKHSDHFIMFDKIPNYYNPHINRKKELIDYQVDSVKIVSGRNFHFVGKESSHGTDWYYCKPIINRKSDKKSASFKNCVFNKIRFQAKVSNVSFEGSTFIDSQFENSEFYNTNFKNIKGEVYIYGRIKFDSIIVSENFEWLSYQKRIDSILSIKLSKKYKNRDIKHFVDRVGMDSTIRFLKSDFDIHKTIERLEWFHKINKRLLVSKSGDSLIIRDSIFINKVKELTKLSAINKGKRPPRH